MFNDVQYEATFGNNIAEKNKLMSLMLFKYMELFLLHYRNKTNKIDVSRIHRRVINDLLNELEVRQRERYMNIIKKHQEDISHLHPNGNKIDPQVKKATDNDAMIKSLDTCEETLFIFDSAIRVFKNFQQSTGTPLANYDMYKADTNQKYTEKGKDSLLVILGDMKKSAMDQYLEFQIRMRTKFSFDEIYRQAKLYYDASQNPLRLWANNLNNIWGDYSAFSKQFEEFKAKFAKSSEGT